MNGYDFKFGGEMLTVMPSGGLWWPFRRVLAVSDLHLGKSDRIARAGGALLPPYETLDTLHRLRTDIAALAPATVICLGDSFDDLMASRTVSKAVTDEIAGLQAGREWIWIEGNHDPGPLNLGGTHLSELTLQPVIFRHIADPDARAEISGHYHPKARISARGRSITRPALLFDHRRIIMPAYGTYTGGLRSTDEALSALMDPKAVAVLLGDTPRPIPMPRGQEYRSSTAAR